MIARALMTLPLLLATGVANADDFEPEFDPRAWECPPPSYEDEHIVIEDFECYVVDGVPVYGTYHAVVRHHYVWHSTPTVTADCYMTSTQEPIEEWVECP